MRYKDMTDRIIHNSVLALDSFHEGTPCWIWTGRTYVNRTGEHYGRINVRVRGKHKTVKVHRLVITEIKGRRLPRNMVAKHLCNNTLCCNPAHLIGGTQSTNMKQCVADGRHNSQKRKAAA